MLLLQTDTTSIMTEGTYKIWTLVFYGLQAIGTISVAILAIYGDRILRKLFKPKFKIEISSESPFVETIQTQNSFSADIKKYTRISLKVTNSGETTAKNCQGIIETIFCKRTRNETFYKFKTFIPTRFIWNDDKESTFITPEIPYYLEIGRIQQVDNLISESEDEHQNGKQNQNYDLYLSIEEPNEKGKYMKLGKGTFIIPLLLYTDNLRQSEKAYVEIYWNGKDLNNLTQSDFYAKQLKELPKEIC